VADGCKYCHRPKGLIGGINGACNCWPHDENIAEMLAAEGYVVIPGTRDGFAQPQRESLPHTHRDREDD
jgi:hypothetical protein